MPRPPSQYGRKQTGRFRHIRGWYGNLKLQIEVENEDVLDGGPDFHWIDAREGDLYQLDYLIQARGEIPTFNARRSHTK